MDESRKHPIEVIRDVLSSAEKDGLIPVGSIDHGSFDEAAAMYPVALFRGRHRSGAEVEITVSPGDTPQALCPICRSSNWTVHSSVEFNSFAECGSGHEFHQP